MGQSSTPKWIPGTIEFIWAGGIPLPTHHKLLSSQILVFRDPKIDPKRSQPKMSTRRSQNLTWSFSGANPFSSGANPSFCIANPSFSGANPSFSGHLSFFRSKPKLSGASPSFFRSKPELFHEQTQAFQEHPQASSAANLSFSETETKHFRTI